MLHRACLSLLAERRALAQRRPRRTFLGFASAWLLLAGLSLGRPPAAAAQAYARRAGEHYLLGNHYLERIITLTGGAVHTVELRNRQDGRDYAVTGGEFQLRLIRERVGYHFGEQNPWVLESNDFLASPPRIRKLADGGVQLRFPLKLRHAADYGQPGLAATLVYSLGGRDFFTRQWLRLRTTGRGKLFLDSAAPFIGRIGGERWRLGGFGQPLFSRDLFLGLEFPTSINRAHGSQVRLGRVVGVNIGRRGYRTQPAVIGVAPAGAVHAWFMRYVARIRVAPVRPYLLYNTWFDMPERKMTEAKLLRRARQFRRILTRRYRLKLNAFVLDDAWDNYRQLWHVDRSRFPGGFRPLARALGTVPTHLGLWFGPIGGYSHRRLRLAAARRLGMEITTNGQFLCLAGRKYQRYFTARLLSVERRFGVAYFKLDGIPFGCNDPNHGHPVGIYSREADMRAFKHILKKLRAQNPHVFLNATTSVWLSPWWLKYADTVWMGGADSGYLPRVPALEPRESAISYRDSVLYRDFVLHRLQFPMNSLMTHGIIRGKYNLLGGKNEPEREWENEIVHYFSVGNMMYELYITPSLLNRREWNALAAGIRWAEANAHPLLDNSRLVLGDPAQRQVYGFVHASPAKIIITLRNPFVTPRNVKLPLTAANGFIAGSASWRAETIYPYRRQMPGTLRFGGNLRLRLGAYEERMIELRPASAGMRLTGARYTVLRAARGAVSLALFAPAGENRTLRLGGVKGALRRRVHFGPAGAHESEPRFSPPRLSRNWRAAASPTASLPAPAQTLQLHQTLNLPADFLHSRLALLVRPEKTSPGLTAQAWDNGNITQLQIINGGKGRWYWLRLPLTAGHHAVRWRLALPPHFAAPCRLTLWLLADRRLAETTLPLQLLPGVRLPRAELLPEENALQAKAWRMLDRELH